MQLRKPIVARAVVKPEAVELAIDIATDRWERLKSMLELRGSLNKEDTILAARIQPLVKGQKDAVEHLKADLNGMPYEEVGATSWGERNYLYGLTKPIIATAYGMHYGRRSRNSYNREGEVLRKYDIGPYQVVLAASAFIDRSLSNCHLVPIRDPHSRWRHYHHVAYAASYNDDCANVHPLDMRPSWCTASFSGIFNSLFGVMDFAAMFKIMHRFLSIYNVGSPLASNLPHARRIEE